MSKQKKSSKPLNLAKVTRQLQTSITKVATLPKGPYKTTDAKKSSNPVSPTDVATRLQTSIKKVATLPKFPYKITEAKKTKRRSAKDTH